MNSINQSTMIEEDAVVSKDKIRFAAVGDLHCTKDSAGSLRDFFSQAG